jgi:hypothetical protein
MFKKKNYNLNLIDLHEIIKKKIQRENFTKYVNETIKEIQKDLKIKFWFFFIVF